jgi:murein DD-endopeptidase MepM/ murein hydrolase activator NlpD
MPEGTPVCAAREGFVVNVENSYSVGKGDPSYKNSSNLVWIRHSDRTMGRYCHFMKDGVKVNTGQKVKAGEYLGLSGNTGYSTGPHLHFDVFKALDHKRQQTLPVKFKTLSEKSVILGEGNFYTAP